MAAIVFTWYNFLPTGTFTSGEKSLIVSGWIPLKATHNVEAHSQNSLTNKLSGVPYWNGMLYMHYPNPRKFPTPQNGEWAGMSSGYSLSRLEHRQLRVFSTEQMKTKTGLKQLNNEPEWNRVARPDVPNSVNRRWEGTEWTPHNSIHIHWKRKCTAHMNTLCISKSQERGWGEAQWLSPCLACVRVWITSTMLQNLNT